MALIATGFRVKAPADLAHALLVLAKESRQNGMFFPDSVPTLETASGLRRQVLRDGPN
jgi:hypothetical protein